MKKFIKQFLPRSLFGRSLLILVIPVLMIEIVTTFVFFDRHLSAVTDRLTFAVAGEIAVIANEIEQNPHGLVWQQTASNAAQSLSLHTSYTPGVKIAVPNPSHTLIARTLDTALNNQLRRPHLIETDVHEKWVKVAVQLKGGAMIVSLPQYRLFSSSGYIFLLWMIGTSLVLLGVAVLFMRNQIRPIRRLAVVAERLGRGQDIPPSFKPEGAREIRQAARAFIDMHGRIRRQVQQRTAMLAGVSHDLRTPLTRMKLQMAMLAANPDVEALKGDVAEMERMIDAYLNFARGEGAEGVVRTDLREMLERVAANARRQGAIVNLSLTDDLSLQARPVAFERAINNIVGNAHQYGGQIWIAAVRRPHSLVISVDDNGPGVPENQYEEIFKPFVRGDPSRNPATGGVGLGLPIAQDIIHAHGGHIVLAKSPHGGLRLIIQLPA